MHLQALKVYDLPELPMTIIILKFSTRLLKRMQKQGSKHRSIKFMLNKSFGKHFNVWMFLQTQQIISSDFSHCNELSLHKKGLFYNLFYNMMLLLLYFVFMYININFLSLSVLTFFALILCFLDTIIYIFPFFLWDYVQRK